MATLKTSILLELQDNFSKQFAQLQTALGGARQKGTALAKSIGNASKEFVTGSNEVKKYKNNLNNTNEALKGLVTTIGAGIGASKLSNILKGNLAEAGNRQMASIKLSTVIGNNNQKEFEEYFKKIERTGIASFQEIVDTGYNLLSAGLNGNQAKLGAKNVIDVAKITGGQADAVASTMATASKNFNIDMARVGDILAKTQLKFQFANFSQLGSGFDMVGASAAAIKLPLEQTATVLGMLNDAGITGSSAGTALNSMLRQMNVAAKGLGIKVTRSADGSLDIVKFLEEVNSKTKHMDLDRKAEVFQKLFGDEGKKGLLPLIANLDKMSANLEDVSKNSQDIVDTEVIKFYEAYNTKTAKLGQSLAQLSGTLGKLLEPYVTIFIDKLADGIGLISQLIESNSRWGWVIYVVAGALGVLATSILLIKTLGFLNMIFGFTKAFKLMRTAVIFTTGAVRAMSLAMISNPIGALIFALTSGAILLITYWSEVKALFVDFFDWLSNNGFFKMMDKGITLAKSLFSSSETKGAVSNDGVNKVKEASMIGGSNSTSSNTSNNQVYNISVNGSPQPIDTAKEMSRELSKVEQLSMVGG